MLRPLVLALAACPLLAWAGNGPPSPVQCDEEFADCKETCTMEHGTSTRQAARAKLKTCMGRCNFRERDCREAVLEASRSGVEPEVIDRQSPSRAGEDNRPYRATSQQEREEAQRKLDEEKRVEDERRAEEARRRAESQQAAEARRAGKSGAAEKPPLNSERDEPPPPRKAERATEKPEPAPEKAEAQPEKAAPAADRAESPKREESSPQKKAAPAAEEKAPPEKKKAKKEERPLDEWDPDAL